ncbi:hypothetical protein NHX12_020091 [Muraenolepis orangiensis]|uniref:PX domain-containing protein n=1 Tax=Muraenolepis orangiensis TaxID=630683 RepID=A0A9Q0EY09_9TELE|nr:hypothetical protein NHX12_020091 [Muraenolepis orangiensis]
MPDGLATSRTLQNEATGLDLRVPRHREVHGALMTGHVEYLITVVTTRLAFKSPRHQPADVVQLVVSKKYSEMSELYSRLAARYPGVSLPAMPRKTLFVGEADIQERRAAFDELMKAVAEHRVLAACSELMEFLGAKPDQEGVRSRSLSLEDQEDDLFFRPDEPSPPSRRRPAAQPGHTREEEEDEEEEEEEEEPYLGPLGNTKSISKKAPKPLKPLKPQPVKAPLFGDEEPVETDFYFPNKEDRLKLFEDPDLGGAVSAGDSLLLPTAHTKQAEASAQRLPDEDTDSLFRIEDDFDKLLLVMERSKDKPPLAPKPQLKPKPHLKPKPTWSEKPSAGPLAVGHQMDLQPKDLHLKNQVDILKYIQQNQADTTEELDLF